MANEPKWTPGPLEVREAFLRSGDDEWTLHPTDRNWNGPRAWKGHIAYVWGKENADLFAHAAELYKALELANRLLMEHHDSTVMRFEHRICPVCKQRDFEQIDAVLAKARGEQPHAK